MNRRDAIKRTVLLSGYALSASAISGVLQGCKAKAEPGWLPAFFTEEQAATLAELAETILPATDTPGAKDVGVHQFIDQLLKECYEQEEQQLFLDGLAKLEEDCVVANGKAFLKCDPEMRMAFLTKKNEEAIQKLEENTGPGTGPPFFISLKQLVFLGYFSSEEVGEHVLAYDPIPGDYSGCIPLSEVGKTWSL